MPLKTPLRVETKGLWAGIYDADGVLICGNDFATTDTAEDDVKNYAEIVTAVNGRAGMEARIEQLRKSIEVAAGCNCMGDWKIGHKALIGGLEKDDEALAAPTPTQGGEG